MKQIALSEAKAKLSELVDEVRRSRGSIVIQRRSNPVAVLVEIDRFRRLQQMEDRVTSFQLREALDGRKTPLRKVLGELGEI
jgi:prevent-host-death family protein